MATAVQQHMREVWGMLLFRGIALLLFGVVAIVWPGITLTVLAIAFAVYLLVAGVVDIIVGIGAIGRRRLWFLTLLMAVLEIGVGVYALRSPVALTVAVLIFLLGLTLIVRGIIEVIAALEEGTDPGVRFLLMVVGLLSVVAGFVVIRYPATGGLAFVWVLGVYGLIAGALGVAMALSLHSETSHLAKAFSSRR